MNKPVAVPGAADIPGLAFRGFRGEADYPAILAVIEGSKEADGVELTGSVEDVARSYQHLTNCDPYQDMLFVEVDGEVIGYSRVWWWLEADGNRLYGHFASLLPEWRGAGIRRTMVRHNERRLSEIASAHPGDGGRFFETWTTETESHWEALLQGEGYEAVRHRFGMVRPTLDGIPDLVLPEGLAIRPVEPEQIRPIWDAAKEAFQDAPGYSEDNWSDTRFELWRQDPQLRPALWQVAWEGDQVAGMVLNYINEEENLTYDRQRGYTSVICVRRPWRRRGLAKALIARSLQVLEGRGMSEAGLNVEAESPTGATRLYKTMGFQVTKRTTVYRKPLT
jgi:mycothiol synthase